MKIKTSSDLEKIKNKYQEIFMPAHPKFSVGYSSCGIAAGAKEVFQAFDEEARKAETHVEISITGCLGYCGEEPIVTLYKPNQPLIVYNRVDKDSAKRIFESISIGDQAEEKAFFKIEEVENFIDPNGIKYGRDTSSIPRMSDVSYYKKQKRIVLRESGLIDPEKIEDYIAVGGYSSFLKAIECLSPAEVIETVKSSGLRGRGGAGFPTGLKWEVVGNKTNYTKYVICNADEGDPGAYMNRNEMESDPHMLIEGMLIGAYAVGANSGVVYVRAEYPLAIERLRRAIEQAESYGFLGNRICGKDFNFKLSIVCGAGAFVCGEETALIASIEGQPGRPRPRPPFPAEKGLNGMPTVINNVETWCTIPAIVSKGPEWFRSIGAKGGSGTKVFSLVGAVNHVGLVEVPIGTPIKQVVYDIGGGGIDGRKIKAVQTGGPSGGCIPAKDFDLPIDYEHLQRSGSIMGSGGMVVMDERTCMVDVTKYFLSFTTEESCGQCIPCRRGLEYMLGILEDITEGRGRLSHIEELEEIAEVIKQTSLCGLGQTAPNPVLSTIRHFRDEYEAHILEKRCPAGVCKALINFTIYEELCTGCHACMKVCPTGAVTGKKKEAHTIDQLKCVKCGACFEACKFNAIQVA